MEERSGCPGGRHRDAGQRGTPGTQGRQAAAPELRPGMQGVLGILTLKIRHPSTPSFSQTGPAQGESPGMGMSYFCSRQQWGLTLGGQMGFGGVVGRGS